MRPTEAEIEGLEKLERVADELLSGISRSGQTVSDETLLKLKEIAGAAARIAFGGGRPDLLSHQMSRLIGWTDRLDDIDTVSAFQQALKTRPLIKR
jgi:undecaprenyl pyrophosphate phosphatase UppP